jgi:NifU-like protein involved in Fe-S cluster formation
MEEIRHKLLSDMGFSEKAIAILDRNLNMEVMDNPTITEQHQGTCGDILFLSLRITDRMITDASFEYIGCAGLQSCASAMTEMIKGKSLEEAYRLDARQIIDWLEGIPRQKYECAEIANTCVHNAIDSYRGIALKVL